MTNSHSAPACRALVVEGGAMRGIFAAGVLDAFMQGNHYDFDLALGVSAGATNLTGYLARRPGRNRRVITELARQRDFFNPARFMRGGHLTDVNWLWHQGLEQHPLDVQRIWDSMPLYAVGTHIDSGEAAYWQINDSNLHAAMVASCALPYLYRDSVEIDGEWFVDGGVADSIPVRKAYELGARDITVVLSRPRGYRKLQYPHGMMEQVQQRMLQHLGEEAHLLSAMMLRADDYNDSLEFIDHPPADCRVRVIAPPAQFAVSRLTMNIDRLHQGYRMGLAAGTEYLLSYDDYFGANLQQTPPPSLFARLQR
ncbi:patatin family protein [Bacterioplanes sanyensis]|uniref:Patatin family protein n=1 Tax=Bacterioplanes sanyensis TaxID=1249553 RepID=A0A222FIN8_9GAMM|nr:patatin family protein [Bacterioplanes sanyensis]ASP38354.1 patatin family protein [Bacterioplanes sanyensis]